ncbi:DNA polymerase I [Lichenibacterium ramalinae]|uniref:DNA polymerase I n=1 Tax=Lichenibacterium ramalinae TaxID=2316527 RepID=A0A4V1RIC7_9HYPH|nr:DNA polymerase I [Lichenibacterium ramalinae]RYB03287.1 DNA polymerase I [Lichenibacterium ramalinae]
MTQNRPVAAGDHVFLVDASAFIFRAYYQSINQNDKYNKRSDGLPTGGVRLFATKLLQFVREGAMGIVPTHLAVIFDKSENSFRKELFPAYKANRSDPPADLVPQFHLMREAVRAFGLVPVEQDTYEADDLIATYARQARRAGADVTIVSPDKDLMQVVGDGISMYDAASGAPGAAGAREERRIGPDEVVAYFGVGPERVVDVQALAGDSTDNVPGAPGIGIKTAAQLIATFGDLDTLLARAHEIKQPKRREALTLPENVERIRISREMVKLCDTVEVAVPLDALRTPRTEGEKLVAFCKALEFTTLMRRIGEFYGVEPGEVEPDERLVGPGGWRTRNGAPAAPIEEGAGIVATGEAPAENRDAAAIAAALPKLDGPAALAAVRAAEMRALPVEHARYRTVTTLEALDAVIAAAREAGVVAVDTETTSLDARTAELVGVAIAVAPGDAVYIPVGHLAPPPPAEPKEPKKGKKDKAAPPEGGLFGAPEAVPLPEAPPPGQLAVRDVLDRLRPLLEAPDVLKVAQNMKYDWLVFAAHGITVAPFDDTMLMSYVLDAAATTDTHGMDQLAKRHLGHDTIAFKDVAGSGKSFLGFARVPLDRATAYAAEDADVTLRLWRVLKPRLPAERMTAVYETLERPLVPVLARMERRGIAIDSQILSRLSGDFAQTMARLESEIHEAAGEPFNLGSPKQLGDILFGRMGLPGAKKTATGAWSTSAQVLDELAETGNGFARLMLEWRQVSKLKATYTDALPTFADAHGRVHTSFALAATTTGRLSSSDPNIQNIPVRTEAGRKIRTAFVSEPGHKLVSADYSQIELRLLAHIADIPQLKQAFAEGRDIHATTASEMFGVPLSEMTGEVRRRAKAINFGIIYGISAFGLANQLGIARQEAGDYIKTYFERFPGIRDYMEATKKLARAQGYVSTLFGRKCHYPRINASNPSERAFNERAAINMPIQGTAADIIRRAMTRMDAALEAEKIGARMLLQVHDELVFEVADDEIERAVPVIKRVMVEAPHPVVALSVPLAVEAGSAHNWDEAH